MTRPLEAYGVQLKTWYTYKAHLISVKPIPIFIEHLKEGELICSIISTVYV